MWKSVGDIIIHTRAFRNFTDEDATKKLFLAWDALSARVLPAKIARKTRAIRFRHGTFFISVPHASVAAALYTRQQELLAHLRSAFVSQKPVIRFRFTVQTEFPQNRSRRFPSRRKPEQ